MNAWCVISMYIRHVIYDPYCNSIQWALFKINLILKIYEQLMGEGTPKIEVAVFYHLTSELHTATCAVSPWSNRWTPVKGKYGGGDFMGCKSQKLGIIGVTLEAGYHRYFIIHLFFWELMFREVQQIYKVIYLGSIYTGIWTWIWLTSSRVCFSLYLVRKPERRDLVLVSQHIL